MEQVGILSFGDFLKKRKLIDECVIGDGEDAILAIVSGKEYVPDPNFGKVNQYT